MENITGYHYTNERAYRSMQTKGVNGGIIRGFNEFTGLIPIRRFISLGDGCGLPGEAFDGVIEGLLEPEPESWTNNEEYPCLWRYLMNDICRKDKVILLKFELKPDDKAYVVERAHIEDILYSDMKGEGMPTKQQEIEAYSKYWNSRVPVLEYEGGYKLPQLAIWSGIEFPRLEVVWEKSSDDVWKQVIGNGW